MRVTHRSSDIVVKYKKNEAQCRHVHPTIALVSEAETAEDSNDIAIVYSISKEFVSGSKSIAAQTRVVNSRLCIHDSKQLTVYCTIVNNKTFCEVSPLFESNYYLA